MALAVQDQAGAEASLKETGITYPILADADHRVADAYGVFNLLNDNVAAPAAFVINPAGEIVWSYIGQDFNDRPANDLILSNLPSF